MEETVDLEAYKARVAKMSQVQIKSNLRNLERTMASPSWDAFEQGMRDDLLAQRDILLAALTT